MVSGKGTIKVILMDGRIYDAEIVGIDQRFELGTLLKIEGVNFPVVTMGNSNSRLKWVTGQLHRLVTRLDFQEV